MILGDNSPYKRLDIGNVFPRVFIYLFVYLYTLYGASNQKKITLMHKTFFPPSLEWDSKFKNLEAMPLFNTEKNRNVRSKLQLGMKRGEVEKLT